MCLPPGDCDRWRANLVFSWARVHALGDVVIADCTSAILVATAAHVTDHGSMRAAAQIREEASADHYPMDMFYLFALMV